MCTFHTCLSLSPVCLLQRALCDREHGAEGEGERKNEPASG